VIANTQLLAHAPLGPSAAEGWATCADYVNANRGLPDEPSYAAAEGTFAHEVSEMCFDLGGDPKDFIGYHNTVELWQFEWSAEDAELLHPGIARVRSLGGHFFGEHRVDISPWTIEGQFGTLDRAIVTDEAIYINDLKWGRYPVYAFYNRQLVLYALGFWNKHAKYMTQTKKFILEIDQPRCAGGGGMWETTLDELLRYGEWLRKRAEATQQPNPPRTASEKGCQWCKRRKAPGGCDTYDSFIASLMQDMFDDEDAPSDPVLRRSFLLEHKQMVLNYFEMLEEQELDDYRSGKPTPGRKLVYDGRRGTRDKWTSESKAKEVLEKLLGPKAFKPPSLVTPKQALDKVSPEDIVKVKPLITPGEKGTVMVSEADVRPAIPVIDFEEEDENGL